MPNSIRYRNAILLLWVAMALVTNPVWHAACHLSSDHHSEHPEHTAHHQWVAEDVCPYCDAVSQCAEVPEVTTLDVQWMRVGDIMPLEVDYADLRLLLSTRLRAPPVLV